jgi:hypothetical protein
VTQSSSDEPAIDFVLLYFKDYFAHEITIRVQVIYSSGFDCEKTECQDVFCPEHRLPL